MKKLFITMCAVLCGLCASAQEKGDMAVGVNVGVAPCLESGASLTNFGFGGKFQYNISNPIRLEAGVNYGLKDKGVDVFDASLNLHYLFSVSEKFKIYPLVGVGYGHIGISDDADFALGDYDDIDFDDIYDIIDRFGTRASGYDAMYDEYEVEEPSNSKFLLNVGVGAEYSLTDKLSLGAEVKYQYMKDFSRLPISVGLTYRF
ncbi:MAG: outer membrane beta-barrel protein [Prevotellaceae bacterium]|nr:outer membrane beta-barrel protein [Prevotellaceae bacterium]